MKLNSGLHRFHAGVHGLPRTLGRFRGNQFEIDATNQMINA